MAYSNYGDVKQFYFNGKIRIGVLWGPKIYVHLMSGCMQHDEKKIIRGNQFITHQYFMKYTSKASINERKCVLKIFKNNYSFRLRSSNPLVYILIKTTAITMLIKFGSEIGLRLLSLLHPSKKSSLNFTYVNLFNCCLPMNKTIAPIRVAMP